MRKKPVRKLLAACIAGALFFPVQGFTLGLGDIEVSSSLNQDLSADIKLLSAAPEDAQSLIVKLASRKEFARAGIDRPYSLNELKFKTVIIDNVPHIKITTKQPVRAPYLNFLLEVDWPKGHLLREYTILLDPPTFMSKAATPAQTAAAANNTAFRPSSSSNKPVSSASPSVGVVPAAGFRPQSSQTGATPAHTVKQNAAVALQAGSRGHQSASKYQVQRGDTAWSLANSMRPNRSVTVEQMMIALLRANPDSFNHKNINGLKRGYILRIPDAKAIAAISPTQAQSLVHKQTALWQQYRRAYAGGQPVSTVANPITNLTGKNATAKNAAENVTNVPVKEKGAHLQIVSAGTGASTSSTKNPAQMNARELRETLSLAREQLESERVEKESLQQKVDQLEHQVSKMQGVLPIEDNKLAQAQTLAEKTSTATESTGKETENPVIKSKTTENKLATASTETTPANVSTAEKTSNKPVTAAPQPRPAQRPVSEMKHRQMGPLAQLLNNPMLLAAAGSGLLLLLALIYLVIKRRKTTVEETEAPAADANDLEDVADMVEEDQHEDNTETDSESTLVMDAEETAEEDTAEEAEAMAKAKAEEIRDDVIAEADVYLAYGIYQQAEELLDNAIKEHPERDDYRVKLAETHYASKNKEAFIDTAKQLRQNSGDDTPSWKKVLVMGQDLCVDDPLFQGSLVGGLDMDALPSKTPGMDFDLGMETEDETSSDKSVGMDEPLDLPDMEEETELDSITSDDEETAINMAEEADAQAGDSSMDELEFDLSETAAVTEEKTEESVLDEEFSMDIDATELDIDEDHNVAETEVDTDDDDIVLDLSDDGILDEMEAVLPVDADTADQENASDHIDEAEGSIELDVDEIDVPVPADSIRSDQQDEVKADDITDEVIAEIDESDDLTVEAEADQSDEEEFDLSSLDDVDEISTKLDLARAYLDMGDHEGTKEILEEVLADGNDEQKREANELMSELDS